MIEFWCTYFYSGIPYRKQGNAFHFELSLLDITFHPNLGSERAAVPSLYKSYWGWSVGMWENTLRIGFGFLGTPTTLISGNIPMILAAVLHQESEADIPLKWFQDIWHTSKTEADQRQSSACQEHISATTRLAVGLLLAQRSALPDHSEYWLLYISVTHPMKRLLTCTSDKKFWDISGEMKSYSF